jgi:hypothetical protein
MSNDEGPLGFLRRKLREACADGAADAWTLRKRITDVLHAPQWEGAALGMQAVQECKDHDSPWLVCKPCNDAGRCAQDAAPTREGIADALLIVESYGPWGPDLNDAHRRQIVLAEEVKRLQQDAYVLATMLTEANRRLAGYTK